MSARATAIAIAAAACALSVAGAAGAEPDAPKAERAEASRLAAQLTAGASLLGGNARQIAASASGKIDWRAGDLALGAQSIGNYGRGAAPGEGTQEIARNVWTRARADRFVGDRFAPFLLAQHRYDRFQGLDLRGNLDPGVKYVVFEGEALSASVEAGYDLQHDVRRYADTVVYLDADRTTPRLDPATGEIVRLPRTYTDHSSRLAAGGRYALGPRLSLSVGVEYLQSFRESDRYRINVDALAAATLTGALGLGVGFLARWDNAPLPGKRELDAATTVSLVVALERPSRSAPAPADCPPAR